MSQQSPEHVFFTYIDEENTREGRWITPPPVEELEKRYADFQAYLDRQVLSPTERQGALEAYEGHLLLKVAFSGSP